MVFFELFVWEWCVKFLDVVVIGGGLGGLLIVLVLCGCGFEVWVFEKCLFFEVGFDKLCGEGFMFFCFEVFNGFGVEVDDLGYFFCVIVYCDVDFEVWVDFCGVVGFGVCCIVFF